MTNRIHYTQCPVCGSSSLKTVLSAKDYTVSGESFDIIECAGCTLRFTQDVPDALSIGPYYKSEEYISHTNTSKGLINRLYQAVRRRTLVRKRKLVQQATGLQRGRLLDVGSGTGSFAHTMKENGWDTTGLEPDEQARTVARNLYGLELGTMDTFYRLPAGSFDAITLWHVMEHVHDLQAYVQQLKSLLREKGKLLVAVPNYTSRDATAWRGHWAAYDVPRHLYHFSPRSIEVLMEKHGLKIEAYKPMWYDSFYISLLSSKYKNGKPGYAGAFMNGLLSNLGAIGNVRKCSSVIYIISQK